MKQIPMLMEIGSIVEVDLPLVKDRIPDELLKLLSDNSVGTVIDYKMTDGSGTGVVLQLVDGSLNWFFYEELKVSILSSKSLELTEDRLQKKSILLEKNYLAQSNQKKRKLIGPPIQQPKTIVELFNPFLFFKWFLHALKDVY